jgi:hypothetical protein
VNIALSSPLFLPKDWVDSEFDQQKSPCSPEGTSHPTGRCILQQRIAMLPRVLLTPFGCGLGVESLTCHSVHFHDGVEALEVLV